MEKDDNELFSLMREVFISFSCRLNACFEDYGITGIQGIVLMELYQNGHQQISQLCHATGMSKSNLSAILKRLQQHGFIRRERSKKDQRAAVISLEAKGEDIMKQICSTKSQEKQKMVVLSEKDKQVVMKGLLLLSKALEETYE